MGSREYGGSSNGYGGGARSFGGGGRGGSSGGQGCFKCGEHGHMSRECPKGGYSGGGRGGGGFRGKILINNFLIIYSKAF